MLIVCWKIRPYSVPRGLGIRTYIMRIGCSLLYLCCLFLRGYYLRAAFYLFEKPADINDGWIRYVRVRQWRLLDTVSSTRSLSGLLSAVETCRTTGMALGYLVTIVRNYSHTCACAAYTNRGYYSALFNASDFVATMRAPSLRQNTHGQTKTTSAQHTHTVLCLMLMRSAITSVREMNDLPELLAPPVTDSLGLR